MFTCSRRLESFMSARDVKGADYWTADGTCSWCGGISPEIFFEAVEAGCELGPTDKDYKVYVALRNPLAGKVACEISASHPLDGFELMTPELAETVAWKRPADREEMLGRWVRLTTHEGVKNAKFYFQHLDADGRTRFVDLYNDRKMKIGFPGFFYTRPYFCVVTPS